MKQNKKLRKKSLIFILAALLVMAAYIAGASLLMRAEGPEKNTTDLREYNEDSSLILLTGKDYSLEKEQEDLYLEQKKTADQQMKPPEKKEKKTAESIVKQKTEESGNGTGTEEGKGEGEGKKGKPRPEPETEPETEPPTQPEPEPETEAPDLSPNIEANIGNDTYGSNVAFTVRGTDYNGRVIESFYYVVTFDGNQIYSTETSADGWVTYRANNQAEGPHLVVITITDTEGHQATGTYTLIVEAAADVPVDEWVTLEVEARTVGGGYILNATEQIYKNESAAHFVQRVLSAYGFTPGMDDSSYLYRIAGINVGEANVPDAIKPFVEETFGELYGVNVPGALGERDFTPSSGWVYLYNGVYQGVGLYGVTLVDGDMIHLGFTLAGGNEYNGTWLNYGAW